MHAILLLLLVVVVVVLSSRSILWIDLDDDGRLLFAAPEVSNWVLLVLVLVLFVRISSREA